MLPLKTDRRKEGEYFFKAHYHCKQYYSLCPTIMKEQPAFCSTPSFLQPIFKYPIEKVYLPA
jgi:hypothetical protein